jgi:hypothetical protein
MVDLRSRKGVSARALEWGHPYSGAQSGDPRRPQKRNQCAPPPLDEAQLKRAGIGYLDPVQNRIATQYGFRSTFRDWAAKVALFPREVIEHALAHKLKDEAEAYLTSPGSWRSGR